MNDRQILTTEALVGATLVTTTWLLGFPIHYVSDALGVNDWLQLPLIVAVGSAAARPICQRIIKVRTQAIQTLTDPNRGEDHHHRND